MTRADQVAAALERRDLDLHRALPPASVAEIADELGMTARHVSGVLTVLRVNSSVLPLDNDAAWPERESEGPVSFDPSLPECEEFGCGRNGTHRIGCSDKYLCGLHSRRFNGWYGL